MKSALPVHNAALVQNVNSQNNLCHVQSCPSPHGIAEASSTGNEEYLLLSTLSHSTENPAKSNTGISKSYKYPNNFTHHFTPSCS